MGFYRAVEPAHAAEAGGEGDFGQGQGGFRQQFFGEQQALVEGHGLGRNAQFLLEQLAQVALANTQPRGQFGQAARGQRPFLNQPQCPLYGGGTAFPGRAAGGGLGTAAQAGPVAGFRCLGGQSIVTDVPLRRLARGADRPAVNARGFHRQEEFAVKAPVAGHSCLAAAVRIQCG